MKHFNIKALIMLGVLCVLLGIFTNLAVNRSDNILSASDVKALTSWLLKNGITVSEDIIDTEIHYVMSASLENSMPNDEQTAKKLLLGNVTLSEDTYTNDNGALSFSGDRFTLTAADGYLKNITSGADRYNAGKRAEKIAMELGFNLGGSMISYTSEDGLFTCVVTKTIDKRAVFNDYFTITMNKNSLLSADGVWYTISGSKNKTRKAKSAADALTQLLNQGVGDITITSMTLGYNMTNDKTAITPVWRIETEDNGIYYIDA